MHLVFALLLLFLAEWGTPDFIAQPLEEEGREPAIVTVTNDGAWCWFSDPRAVYFEGRRRRTYSGWVDSRGNITIGFYDHDNGTISRRTIHEQLEVDDHDHPALLFAPDGRLLVFYSKHSTSTPIYLAEAREAESLSAWSPPRELALNDTATYRGLLNSYTYTNPCLLSGEDDRIYLFWRGMDFKPNLSWSDDLGKTWAPGRILILPERTYANRRPYLKVADNGRDRMHLAFTDGHPRNEEANSIYYAGYREGAFHRADGQRITTLEELPIDPAAADIVYDASTTGEKAWVWDVAEGADGQPVIVYVRFPDDTQHVYYYARWDGSRWQNHRLLDAGKWFPQTPPGKTEPEPNYSGGLALDQEDPSIVYLSRQLNGLFEIERWQTPDGGNSWNRRPLTSDSKRDNVRPAAVRNAGPGNALQVLWMRNTHYRHYTDYRSSLQGTGDE